MSDDIMAGRVDEIHEPKRAEDFSTAARMGSWFLKWNGVIVFVLTLVASYLVASGFGWETPEKKFAEVTETLERNRATGAARADTLRDRMDIADRKLERVSDIIEGLAIDACARRRNDAYARRKLRCDELGR